MCFILTCLVGWECTSILTCKNFSDIVIKRWFIGNNNRLKVKKRLNLFIIQLRTQMSQIYIKPYCLTDAKKIIKVPFDLKVKHMFSHFIWTKHYIPHVFHTHKWQFVHKTLCAYSLYVHIHTFVYTIFFFSSFGLSMKVLDCLQYTYIE